MKSISLQAIGLQAVHCLFREIERTGRQIDFGSRQPTKGLREEYAEICDSKSGLQLSVGSDVLNQGIGIALPYKKDGEERIAHALLPLPPPGVSIDSYTDRCVRPAIVLMLDEAAARRIIPAYEESKSVLYQ